jgi:hypothetical protein
MQLRMHLRCIYVTYIQEYVYRGSICADLYRRRYVGTSKDLTSKILSVSRNIQYSYKSR